MTYTAQMLDTYPAQINMDTKHLAEAIDRLIACSQACTACADACLSEGPEALPRLTRCIRDNLDCADICDTTARVLSRHTGYDANLTRAQVQAAVQALKTCGDSCAEHRDAHEHCRVCEQACRDTEQVVNAVLPQLQPSGAAPAEPSQAAPQT
ncbi:MAG: four-helix bundle copper-binding protein [Actinomycetota bacterium]|nr:four-helix bundle copper-binding protein [Actinomycetota bacterium]